MDTHGIGVAGSAAAAIGWGGVRASALNPAARADGGPSAAPPLDAAADADLIRAFADGRADAFDEIVRRHRRQVYLVCYRFMGTHEDAADVAQEVFVRAFRGLGRFKQRATLRTWLYRVAVNTCLNHRAVKRPDMEPVDAVDRIDAAQRSPEDDAQRHEQRDVVRRAIRLLPPRQRAIVVLRVYEELSHQDIARVLGTTVGASKTNFFHALANLRRLLTPAHPSTR